MVFKKTRTIYPHRDATKFYSYWATFQAIWESFKERLKIEKDVFVLMTGSIGSGKSTLAGKICLTKAMNEINFIKYPEVANEVNDKIDKINKNIKKIKLQLKKREIHGEDYDIKMQEFNKKKKEIFEQHSDKMMFIPEKHFIVDSDEFAVKMITEQGTVIWYDEAREGVNRQLWYDKINRSIKQRKNTNRKNFNVYFMILPLEVEFDPKLASHLAAWIWVRRGVGEIYVANNERKGGKGLNIDSILKREEKYLQENPKRTIVPPVIHPEYVGRVAFGKFSKKQKKMYKDLVEKKHAIGKLTDEEKEKYGIEVKKSPETIIEEVCKRIKNKEITDKISAWEELRGLEITDEKKVKLLNFYLGLLDMGTFNRAFNNKKKELSNLANILKKTS